MTKLAFENYYPYLLAIISACIWYGTDIEFAKSDALLSATLSVSGILIGFLATCKAILISMNSPIIARLKQTGYIQDLVSYFAQAIWLNIAFCLVNVIGFFGDNIKTTWYPYVWILCAVCAAMAFVRVTEIMLKVFKNS